MRPGAARCRRRGIRGATQGAARGAVAIGFFKDIVGREISFFEQTWYMAPMGVLMTVVYALFTRETYGGVGEP